AQDWQRSHQLTLRAATLAQTFGDPVLLDEVDDQRTELSMAVAVAVRDHLDKAVEDLVARRFEQAHQGVVNAGNLVKFTDDQALR
ncbi:MAG: hypothetical protein KDE58_38220, partial [Caldilineaceae bacterium]|nr:hypothetical protein [Caldilineaceae bacterium]